MKETIKNNKIVIGAITLIILIGIIITATIGINLELKLQETKKIELYIGKQVNISEIKDIAKEVTGKETIAQTIELFEDTVSITSKEITDEQKVEIINKINEKYETEISSDNIEIVTTSKVNETDIFKPYITPLIIATIAIIIYMIIRYNKLDMAKVGLKTIISIILAQVVLLSIIAITRIPVGRLTLSMMLVVYVGTLLVLTTKFEEQLKLKKEEKEIKRKNRNEKR